MSFLNFHGHKPSTNIIASRRGICGWKIILITYSKGIKLGSGCKNVEGPCYYQVFHDRSFLGRCFRGFVRPVLEDCSVSYCSVSLTMVSVVPPFLTGVVECRIAHRRFVLVLCMLYTLKVGIVGLGSLD